MVVVPEVPDEVLDLGGTVTLPLRTLRQNFERSSSFSGLAAGSVACSSGDIGASGDDSAAGDAERLAERPLRVLIGAWFLALPFEPAFEVAAALVALLALELAMALAGAGGSKGDGGRLESMEIAAGDGLRVLLWDDVLVRDGAPAAPGGSGASNSIGDPDELESESSSTGDLGKIRVGS